MERRHKNMPGSLLKLNVWVCGCISCRTEHYFRGRINQIKVPDWVFLKREIHLSHQHSNNIGKVYCSLQVDRCSGTSIQNEKMTIPKPTGVYAVFSCISFSLIPITNRHYYYYYYYPSFTDSEKEAQKG